MNPRHNDQRMEPQRLLQVLEDGSYALVSHSDLATIEVVDDNPEFIQVDDEKDWKALHTGHKTGRFTRVRVKEEKQDTSTK